MADVGNTGAEAVMNNLKLVQKQCLSIMEAVDALCAKHGIRYSLTGGSVIGAYLYNGFIPWDDDIDIMMTRDNYDRFLEVCGELPSRFSVKNFENGKDKNVLFSKVVDECTTAVERKADGTEVVSGIFVDITVFDNFPTGKIKRFYWSFLSKLVQRCVSTESVDDRGIEALLKKISGWFVRRNPDKFYGYVKKVFTSRTMENHSEDDLTELLAGFTIPYKKELFSEYVQTDFDGASLMMVKDYMGYLETRYGRREFYRERRPDDLPHHLVYVNCDLPYREYGEDVISLDKKVIMDEY